MKQTIEIKKKNIKQQKCKKIHGKIQQKMTHKIIWKKKHLVDFERERKETKIDNNNNNKQMSCERRQNKQKKKYARLSFVGTLRK